ncbi:hypothetical protein JCM10449v2_005987 [Rhodotorula kratochvilovae]
MRFEAPAYWPAVGSVWQHYCDLVLVTQLAALRAGFNLIGRSYERGQRSFLLRVLAAVEITDSGWRRKRPLLGSWPVDSNNIRMGAYEVTEVLGDNCDRLNYPNNIPDQYPKMHALRVGHLVHGWCHMNLIEGSLRCAARREGRFIAREDTPTSIITGAHELHFSCVVNAAYCKFLVRFQPKGFIAPKQPRWMCVEIRNEHTCISDAKEPQEGLTSRMDFFIFEDDQRIGFYPDPPTPAAEPSPPPPPPEPPATAAAPLPRPSAAEALAAAERSATELRAVLAGAEAAVEGLKASVAAAEKRVEKERGRVEAKRRRRKRQAEKARLKGKVEEGGKTNHSKKRDEKATAKGKKRVHFEKA